MAKQELLPQRLCSAAACAIAAARGAQAVEEWLKRLTDDDIVRIKRRLAARQEWEALRIFEEKEKQNGPLV